jgi:AraC family transcriptional regulator
MHPAVTNYGREPALSALPTQAAAGAKVMDLLRRAGDALDRDRAASRRYVSSALALLSDRADAPAPDERCMAAAAPLCGGLALWQQRRVRDFVAANIGGPVAVGSLAALARLSPSHFRKAFKTTFGVTPHAYVMRERVAHARVAIASTHAPLSEIALDLGFSDQAHLCRAFRRTVGDSPARWRRMHHRDA